jgi:F0F1-type ATP synthase epsilon subunit
MAEVRLTAEEAQALRAAVSALVIKTRTGELGIMHGADRFVSTQLIYRKEDRRALDAAARKLGLGGVREHGG